MRADLLAQLASLPEVAKATPRVLVPASLTREIVFLIYGVDPAGPEGERIRLLSGRALRRADDAAMMTLGAARDFFGLRDRVSLVKVKVDDPRQVGAVRRAIEARFPDVTAITSGRSSS